MSENIHDMLKSFQINAIREIYKSFDNNINPICSLPTGKGKTLVACAIIKEMQKKCQRIIIIVKSNNLSDPWITELKKFDIKYILVHGTERKEKIIDDKYIFIKDHVILTSHQTASKDIEYFLNMDQFDLMIIDEIHNIINSKKITQMYENLIKIYSERKLFLSATPIQNRKEDLGLIYIMLNKPYLFSDYLNEIDSDDDKQNNNDTCILSDAYNEALDKNIIIQLQDEKQFVLSEMNEYNRSSIIISIPLYKNMEIFIMQNQGYLETGKFKRNKYSHRLEQFLSHPDSIYKNNTIIENKIKCGKIDTVKTILKNTLKNEKIIIFSRYKDVLFQYSKELRSIGYETVVLTGEDRSEAKIKIKQFKNNRNIKILLSTLFKSGEGVNVPEANHLIILELWWNPQRIIQAMGRIDRLSQEKDIFVYILCYNKNGNLYGTDDDLLEMMEEKNEEAKKVIHSQSDLPKMRKFLNENTYIDELEIFLHEYMNRSKTYSTLIDNDGCDIKNRNKKEWKLQRCIIEEKIDDKIRQILNEDLPSPLGDLDLSGLPSTDGQEDIEEENIQ